MNNSQAIKARATIPSEKTQMWSTTDYCFLLIVLVTLYKYQNGLIIKYHSITHTLRGRWSSNILFQNIQISCFIYFALPYFFSQPLSSIYSRLSRVYGFPIKILRISFLKSDDALLGILRSPPMIFYIVCVSISMELPTLH